MYKLLLNCAYADGLRRLNGTLYGYYTSYEKAYDAGMAWCDYTNRDSHDFIVVSEFDFSDFQLLVGGRYYATDVMMIRPTGTSVLTDIIEHDNPFRVSGAYCGTTMGFKDAYRLREGYKGRFVEISGAEGFVEIEDTAVSAYDLEMVGISATDNKLDDRFHVATYCKGGQKGPRMGVIKKSFETMQEAKFYISSLISAGYRADSLEFVKGRGDLG